jgi:hypothetical protein
MVSHDHKLGPIQIKTWVLNIAPAVQCPLSYTKSGKMLDAKSIGSVTPPYARILKGQMRRSMRTAEKESVRTRDRRVGKILTICCRTPRLLVVGHDR